MNQLLETPEPSEPGDAATYRRGGAGARIAFSTQPCPLGFLLVAATPQGVCSVALGDAPETLETALREEFPAAKLRRDDVELGAHMQTLLRFLQGREPHLDLPLDVQATAFQQRVWQELRAIGYGQTRTYSQVAQAIGQPTAVRAVARACAANPVALVVPCHRVVRAVARACAANPVALVVPCHRVVREGGALAGYRWGLERKKALLKRERED